MNRYLSLIILFYSTFLIGQDQYHSELLLSLSENYDITNPTYIINNTEAANSAASFVYGAASKVDNPSTDLPTSIVSTIIVSGPGNNPWDSGFGVRNSSQVSLNDIVLVTFWAKKNSDDSELSFFAEDSETFDKEFFYNIELAENWTQYFFPFKAKKTYGSNGLSMGIHLGARAQSFDIAGYTALNYGTTYSIEEMPSTFSTRQYDGIEVDAPWRATAAQRIESLRKADLKINIIDIDGNVINDAKVDIEMTKHQFGFGSAFVTCRMPGNNCFDATYVEKLSDLDGKGHGFNIGVTENAMKWDAWEEGWIGTPTEAVNAIKYLDEQGIKMRGHTLFWPNFNNMPDDISENRTDLSRIRDRIAARIGTMINHPQLKGLVRQWDILNEITQNRDFENIFKNDPNFETGREIYKEIFEAVKAVDPELQLYINDYVVLSGGASSGVIDRYMTYLDEMITAAVPFEGIGFQCHIGSNPTSINKIEETFNQFYERYNKRISVTEYDIDSGLDEETQASYMADILTMAFSHEAVDAFITWGFWDGNHWKQNAPIFNLDWSIKPSGQAYIQKVFNDWWTNDTAMSDVNGDANFRGFKGDYTIKVTKDGKETESAITLGEDMEIQIMLDQTTSIEGIYQEEVIIFPNPLKESFFNIDFPSSVKIKEVIVMNTLGQHITTYKAVNNGIPLKHEFNNGMYHLQIRTEEGFILKSLLVVDQGQ